MPVSAFLVNIISSDTSTMAAIVLAIVIGTFVLEDLTTVVVAILAADGYLSVPLALGSLYAGIVLGDIGVYCLGWLASSHPRLRKYVNHEFVAPFRAWLESRYILTIFSVRFVPGLRLPTYTASGFFRSPLTTFALVAIVATSIWTTFLFGASYWFGNLTSQWVLHARWGIALVFLLALFFVGRYNLQRYRSKEEGAI